MLDLIPLNVWFRKYNWITKTKDNTVEVLIQVNRRGKETGQYRYKFKDGTTKTGQYTPKVFPLQKPWQLSRAGLLAGGFLVGFLLELLRR